MDDAASFWSSNLVGDLLGNLLVKGIKSIPDVPESVTDLATASLGFIGNGINIVKNIAKITDCIQDHFSIHAEAKEARDQAKKIYDKTKLAHYQVMNFQKRIIHETDKMNEKVQMLVEFSNNILEQFNSNCFTTNATLISDLGEIKFFMETLNRNFDLSTDVMAEKRDLSVKVEELMNAREKLFKDFNIPYSMEAAEAYRKEKTLQFSESAYKIIVNKNPKYDPDVIVKIMMKNGFKFQGGKWTDWTVTEANEACKCEEEDDVCNVTATRECTAENCLGEKVKTFDRCEKEKYHFFHKCSTRDQAIVGSCINAKEQMVSTGDMAGHYVSVGVDEKTCYKNCKSIPGAFGCQFKRTNCMSGDCTGECFVVLEPIHSSNNMPDVACYKFRQVTPGLKGIKQIKESRI